MKKTFKLLAVSFAVVAMASCNCNSNKCTDGADSTKCCDTTKKCGADTSASVAGDSTARPEINANDIFAKRMERYTKELILDDAQQAKLAEILTVGADRIEKYIDSNERPSIDQVKAYHAEEVAQVKAILNAEQFARFEKMEEEMAKKFAERAAAKAAQAANAAK